MRKRGSAASKFISMYGSYNREGGDEGQPEDLDDFIVPDDAEEEASSVEEVESDSKRKIAVYLLFLYRQ